MQVILTEDEYNSLKSLADQTQQTQLIYQSLLAQHIELNSKYMQLLRFGVIPNSKVTNAHNY